MKGPFESMGGGGSRTERLDPELAEARSAHLDFERFSKTATPEVKASAEYLEAKAAFNAIVDALPKVKLPEMRTVVKENGALLAGWLKERNIE
jgi:hypothetical protein